MFRKYVYITFLKLQVNFFKTFKVYQTKVSALISNDKQL